MGRDDAGGLVDAEDAADREIWGREFGCVEVVGEVGGGGAAEFCDLVVEVREFDAEKVGGEIAGVVDGVSLDDAGADAEGAEMGGRTGDGDGLGVVVDDVDGAGVVEVDEDGGDGGVVVGGDFFVGAVVDADDLEGVVGEDGGVVGR